MVSTGRFRKTVRRLLIFALSVSVVFCVSCHFGPNFDPRFSRTDVVSQTDPLDQFALSPDGKLVAHFGTGIWPTQHFDGKTLRFFSVSPAKQVGSLQLDANLVRHPGSGRDGLRFCDRGRYLLALEDPENVSVIDTRDFKIHTVVSLREAEEAIRVELLKKPKGNLYGAGDLVFAACAANSPIAAFYVAKLDQDLGNIKVYNIESGSEMTGFDGLVNNREPGGLAVSPSGSTIAFVNSEALPSNDAFPIARSHPEGTDDGTVTEIDVPGHRVVRQFYVPKETLFDDDPIAFAGDHVLALELNKFKPYKPGGHQPLGTDSEEHSVHFFDAATGSEIGSIAEPKLNSFRLRGVSADGQVVLTLDETWRYCIFCSQYNDEHIGMVAEFVLWNRNTGKPVEQSAPLPLVHHSCPWLTIGSCTPSDEVPDIALDQSGNAVIASWATGNQPLSIFSLNSN